MTGCRPYLLVAAIASAPRIAVLAIERGDILAAFTEKSDDFADTFVGSGTFGFIPGEPSAWTQPLYAWFLIPVYWVFGRSWWALGGLQIAIAIGAALLVYETGRRFVSRQAALLAAAIATLSPYLVWHDVHVNREILDQLLAAAIVLLALLAVERHRLLVAALLGLGLGLAVLGNTRLLLLPLVLSAYVGVLRRDWRAPVLIVAVAAVTLVPWLVRNQVSVGCFALTTDTKALWKANNEHTYETLAAGRWIDDVPDLPGVPPTPEQAFGIYRSQGRIVHVDECEQSRFYRNRVLEFWRDEPGEKAKLAGQAVRMLWEPRATRTESGPGSGTTFDDLREWAQPSHSIPLFVLAAVGLFALRRRVAALIGLILAYQTLAATAFAGATRYRVPWDAALALAAGAAVERGLALARGKRRLSADSP